MMRKPFPNPDVTEEYGHARRCVNLAMGQSVIALGVWYLKSVLHASFAPFVNRSEKVSTEERHWEVIEPSHQHTQACTVVFGQLPPMYGVHAL